MQRITRHVDPSELRNIQPILYRHFHGRFVSISAIPKMLDILRNTEIKRGHHRRRRTHSPSTTTSSMQPHGHRSNTSLPNANELEWSFMPRTMS